MASKVEMTLSIPVSEATFVARVRPMNSDSRRSFNGLGNYMSAMAGDPYIGSMRMITGAVQASAAETFTGRPTADETITIANVVLTAKDSGANGTTQFNTSAAIGTTAASLAACINANTTLNKIVVATSALGVTTITAINPGTVGNGLQASETLSNATLAQFTGGVNGTIYTFANGYVAP